MKPYGSLVNICVLLIALFHPGILLAQRGDIIIPTGATVTVPRNAQICADKIFANNPGYGTLTLADPSGLCTGAVVTPVELLTFSAALQEDVVVLSWATATETRSYIFEVQRKAEQGDWSTLGFVDGNGNATEVHTYVFTDNLTGIPESATVLRYRLRQVDLDGRFEYSPEVEIRRDQPLTRFVLEGYPTPCDDALTVRLTLAEAGATCIRLHDITGRVVMTIAENQALPAGSVSIRVRTADIPSGYYLLVAESGLRRRTERVMIWH
ncbi:MAG: T9SS type A sorting domain-containing protein [Bacteroidetes bacterium]|nr:T9SS type A sorting domain-containing protein [Bacteroidota bacterium]